MKTKYGARDVSLMPRGATTSRSSCPVQTLCVRCSLCRRFWLRCVAVLIKRMSRALGRYIAFVICCSAQTADGAQTELPKNPHNCNVRDIHRVVVVMFRHRSYSIGTVSNDAHEPTLYYYLSLPLILGRIQRRGRKTVPLNEESSRFAFPICILEGDSILEKRFHAQLNGRVVGKIVKADFTYPFMHLSLGSIISIKSSGSMALE